MYNFTEIETVFSISKLKSDLHLYLDIRAESHFVLFSANEFSGIEKEIEYQIADQITLISLEITKKYHNIMHFPFRIEVGIGEFTFDAVTNIYTTEKCFASMFYNNDFELITIDFFHRD